MVASTKRLEQAARVADCLSLVAAAIAPAPDSALASASAAGAAFRNLKELLNITQCNKSSSKHARVYE